MRRDTLLSLTAAAALLTLPACGEGLDPAVGPEGEVDPAASASHSASPDSVVDRQSIGWLLEEWLAGSDSWATSVFVSGV